MKQTVLAIAKRMGRPLHLLTALFALLAVALPGGAAFARADARVCVLAKEEPVTVSEASTAADWQCQPSKHDAKAEHTWVRIPASQLKVSNAVLTGDAMAMKGLVLAREREDGSFASNPVTAENLAENWTTGTRFALPLPNIGERGPLFVRIDNPIGPDVALSLSVVSSRQEAMLRTLSLVLLGIVLGMLLLTAVISGFVAMALRQRFAAFHFAFSLLLGIYVASSGSLLFLAMPELALWMRSVIAYASIAWAVALLAPFTLNFFEQGTVSPLMRRLAIASGLLAFSAGFFLPLAMIFDLSLRTAYNLSFIPGAIVTLAMTIAALRKGSRAAKVFVWAWSVPFLFAIERLARNLGFYSLTPVADFGFYLGLAIEAAALTVAVGWRVMDLRRERDAALAERQALEREARRDALTGLRNRRDYDLRSWREGEVLALLDIDHFKHINDTHGHATGDAVLASLGAQLLQEVARGRIIGAWRMGGEEFAVVMQADSMENAALKIEQMRRRIPFIVDVEIPGLDYLVTASAGLTAVDPTNPEESYCQADRLLYAAKRAGRDQLCFDGSTADQVAAEEPPLLARSA